MKSDLISKVLNRRDFLLTAAALTGATALAACSNDSGNNNKASKNYKIVVIPGIGQVPFYEMIRKGAQAEGTKQGVTIDYQAPKNWDPAEQSRLVDAAVAGGAEAIVICPTDPTAMKASLQKAHDKGIPVITIDTFIGDGNYASGSVTFPVAYIGSDNKKGGQLAGEALIRTIGGKGKVYIEGTSEQLSSVADRITGFKDAVTATNGQVTVVGVGYDGGQITKATTDISAALKGTPDIVGIFGATAFSAEGAAVAVKSSSKAGTVKIAHFDASAEGVADLRNGTVDILIGQKPKDMGKFGVQFAIKTLNGDTNLPKKQMTDYIVITKDNVDTPEAQGAIYTND